MSIKQRHRYQELINHVYQLVSPRVFSVKYVDIDIKNQIIVKPKYMAICHADQRYYLGHRDIKTLNQKLPMALIHEACGEVVQDSSNRLKPGQKVVMIPNAQNPEDKKPYIYENYDEKSHFLSSGHDGFMREFVNLDFDRVVPFENIDFKIAAISEFVSVGVHAIDRFNKIAHSKRNVIGIWGDGSLSYVVACILTKLYPESKVIVIGKDPSKLCNFSFVCKTYLSDMLPEDFYIDHAFECAGGEGSYFAIDDIIKFIKPQGSVMLMGVSENKTPINTRNILEKGLSFIGCSRSGREDFEKAILLMEDTDFQKRLNTIIYEDEKVSSFADLHRVFANDSLTPFKTVFEWCI